MKIFLASSISLSSLTIRSGILSESSRAMRFLCTRLPKMWSSLKIDSVTAQSSKALEIEVGTETRLEIGKPTWSRWRKASYRASTPWSWTFCSLSKSFCRLDPDSHTAWKIFVGIRKICRFPPVAKNCIDLPEGLVDFLNGLGENLSPDSTNFHLRAKSFSFLRIFSHLFQF